MQEPNTVFEEFKLFTRSGKAIKGYTVNLCDENYASELLSIARKESRDGNPQIAFGILMDWDTDSEDVRRNTYQHQAAALTSFLGLIPDSASIFVVLNGRKAENLNTVSVFESNGICLFDESGIVISPFKKIFTRLIDNKPTYCNLSDNEAYSNITYIGSLNDCSKSSIYIISGLYAQSIFSFVSGFALLPNELPSAENEGTFMLTLGDTSALTQEFVNTFNKVVENDMATLRAIGPSKYFGQYAKLLLEDLGEHPEFAVSVYSAITTEVSSIYAFTKKCDDYLIMWEYVLRYENINVEDVVAYARNHPEFDFKQFASIHGMYEMAKSYSNNGNHVYDVIRKVKYLESKDKWGVSKKHKYIDPYGEAIEFKKASIQITAKDFYKRGIRVFAAGEALLSGEMPDVDIQAVKPYVGDLDAKIIDYLISNQSKDDIFNIKDISNKETFEEDKDISVDIDDVIFAQSEADDKVIDNLFANHVHKSITKNIVDAALEQATTINTFDIEEAEDFDDIKELIDIEEIKEDDENNALSDEDDFEFEVIEIKDSVDNNKVALDKDTDIEVKESANLNKSKETTLSKTMKKEIEYDKEEKKTVPKPKMKIPTKKLDLAAKTIAAKNTDISKNSSSSEMFEKEDFLGVDSLSFEDVFAVAKKAATDDVIEKIDEFKKSMVADVNKNDLSSEDIERSIQELEDVLDISSFIMEDDEADDDLHSL